MVNLVSFRFQQCLVPLTMFPVERSPETDFLGRYLTTFFGVRNFGNTSAMRDIIFLKMFKI